MVGKFVVWRFSREQTSRALILMAGLVLPQCVLYGPSMLGWKILLPLDILAVERVYLPVDPTHPSPEPQDIVLSDAIFQMEMFRQFAVSEVRSGRLPLWNPYSYCGAPFLAANQPAVFSPFRLIDYLWPSPLAIAWTQLMKALVAGLGAYLFFKRVLRVSFAPAAIGAWCYPLCGFLILWTNHPHSTVALWLPWMLWATDGAVRRPQGKSGLGLALTTAAVLVNGHTGVGAHVLLASATYMVWCMLNEHGWRGVATARGGRSAVTVVGGWFLGVLLSAPQTLPTLEYLQSSHRVAQRVIGVVEPPPVGWWALPQMVLPYFYGSTHRETIYLGEANRIESAAAGYAGLFMTFFLGPLGLCSRRLRSIQVFWLLFGILGISQILDIPVLARVFDLPPLNLLRNNRLVLVTGWAILLAGVAGLEVLAQGGKQWRTWFWGVILLPLLLGGWCLYLALYPPRELSEILNRAAALIQEGKRVAPPLSNLAALDTVRHWFTRMYLSGLSLCLLTGGLWLTLRTKLSGRREFLWSVGFLAVCEMVLTGFGVEPQCDPSLYYPRLPVLEALAMTSPGRVCGVDCLPASLSQTHWLRDIRGYDAVDPVRLVELLELFRDKSFSPSPDYAMTQWFVPKWPSPLGNLLNLRYLIFRGAPPANVQPMVSGPDYWVLENPEYLPRIFVPRRVEVVKEKAQRLQLLGNPKFDPREVAYIESDESPGQPPFWGQARIRDELPCQVNVELEMQTPGVVVLADLWDQGWKAYLNGRQLPVLRANHALRGVTVPAGKGLLEFRYEPASFAWGLRLFWAAAGCLWIWGGLLFRRRRHDSSRGMKNQE